MEPMFRKTLFWAHLICGVTAGAVILVMSVTGVALTYQRQMQYWADTHTFRASPATGTTRKPIAEMVDAVSAVEPTATAVTVTLRSAPSAPAAITMGTKTIYVNPYTAAVYGEGRGQSLRAFFSSMTLWHRYLATSGNSRTTGRAITGASNFLFLFVVLSGMYLWWPRKLTMIQIRNLSWFRRGLPTKARHFNWHNVIGFWSAAVLSIVVGSGVVMSYTWANNLVYTALGETPPAQGARRAGGAGAGAGVADDIDLDGLVARAVEFQPDWTILALRLPTSALAPVTVGLDRGDGGQPQLKGTLTLDAYTGETLKWEGFSSQTPGRRLRSFLRFAHTGEVGGLTGQTVAGAASAAGVLLVYTGLSLSVRRFLSWRARRVVTRA
ncbi:MAG: PepSY-associated TM helix domain-containing protein [Acidobacteriota bacterium]